MKRVVYLEKREEYSYPSADKLYAPGVSYPEYPFKVIADEDNAVYDMIRQVLAGMKLDVEHYGTEVWNPLGEYIRPGDVVAVKPNMVKDYEDKKQYDCTLTHPSVIRAIIDYCIIARAGHIMIGDAPVQGAKMETISQDCSYHELIQFYKNKGVSIEFVDLRRTVSKETKYGLVIPTVEKSVDSEEFITVHLGEESKHYQEGDRKKYRICGYDDERINRLHQGKRHDYILSAKVLEADVIINVPKPKTHRFAGITGAQKNFIGCCADKESLPHFTSGNHCVCDETNQRNINTVLADFFYRHYLKGCRKKHYVSAQINHAFYRLFQKICGKNVFTQGLWYGNDTIWKTIIDLNKIMLYADKNGNMHMGQPQRRIFTIGDMIIAGQKDGPLNPEPKYLGMILASEIPAVFDYTFCKIAGFDESLIPTVHHSIRNEKLSPKDWENILLYSNQAELNELPIAKLEVPEKYHFEAHPFWKDVL